MAGRAARNALSVEERREQSHRIADRLYVMEVYREADAIAVYVSFESEVETHALIEHALEDGKRVFCPKVLSVAEGWMEFYECVTVPFTPPLEAFTLTQKLPEPAGDTLPLTEFILNNPGCNILFLVPGLAFNPAGARIGFGGGFYDRYLSRFTCPARGRVDTVALTFACQVFDEPFPETEEDVRMQTILTPNSTGFSSSGASRGSR